MAAVLIGAVVALAGAGALVASQFANSGTAEAKSNSCRATCEARYGQCYRDTNDRENCTKAYKQCLSACVNG